MKRSTEHILTTHTGSLPRPPDLTATLEALDAGTTPADLDGEKLLITTRLLRKNDSLFVSLGQDDEGELYIISAGGGVYHIVGRPR